MVYNGNGRLPTYLATFRGTICVNTMETKEYVNDLYQFLSINSTFIYKEVVKPSDSNITERESSVIEHKYPTTRDYEDGIFRFGNIGIMSKNKILTKPLSI